jgi:hypothetical protein
MYSSLHHFCQFVLWDSKIICGHYMHFELNLT